MITVSGCAYNNASYAPAGLHASLTGGQISKLNGIMFAYLSIPPAESSLLPPKARRTAGGNFYRPPTAIKIMAGIKLDIHGKSPAPVANADKKNIKNILKTPVSYMITVLKTTLFLKIYSKRSTDINKKFSIANVLIDLKNIRYDKGYEVVSMAVRNKGSVKTVKENFKYSNAGNSFKLKKFETIQNLTVVNKYKEGMTLWVRF